MLDNKKPSAILRRRNGEVVNRIDHKKKIVNKAKGENLNDLEEVEKNLKAEIAGWQANKKPNTISREVAEEQWKDILK